MRVPVLALLFVAAVSYGQAETVEELIDKAKYAGARFPITDLDRMRNSSLWGAKRGKRSVDIVIMNTCGRSFVLETSRCSYRSLVSPGLEPENWLDGCGSTVLGLKSGEANEYAYVNCELAYKTAPELPTYFNIKVVPENTRGDVSVQTESSSDINVSCVVNQGDNTQVIVEVEGRSDAGCSVMYPPLLAASRFTKSKLKGTRNLFVKASKRGTSVRTI